MNCPNCKSENIKIDIVVEQQLKRKKKSLLYWLSIGWFIEPMLWIFLTMPKLLYELFKPKRYKVKTKAEKIAICQNCGHAWKI